MNKQELHEKLEELHDELQQIDSVDSDDRATLQKLMGDIQELLEQEDDNATDRYRGLTEGLTDAIARFEASHPTSTMLMGRVIDALAKMGI
jgi:hypothetical protein